MRQLLPVLFFALMAGCAPTPESEGSFPGDCWDGSDNDDDGAIDCDDPDCAEQQVCLDGPDTDTDNDTDTDTDSGPCENAVYQVFPEAGATGVYPLTTIEVLFDDYEDDATLEVMGPSGAASGVMEWSDDTLVFEPIDPLAPNADYEVTIDFSCGRPKFSFQTSDVGAAVDPGALVGWTWVVDLGDGRFVEPEGIGVLMQDYIEGDVLLGVLSADTEIAWRTGYAQTGGGPVEHETCSLTADTAPASFLSNPFFHASDAALPFSSASGVSSWEFGFSGAFNGDATQLVGVRFAGPLDTRPLVPLLDPGCDEPGAENYPCDDNAICALAASIAVACEACPDGSGVYCLDLVIDSLEGTLVPGLSLVETDPESDPSCPTGTVDPMCATSGTLGGTTMWPAILLVLAAAGARRRSLR